MNKLELIHSKLDMNENKEHRNSPGSELSALSQLLNNYHLFFTNLVLKTCCFIHFSSIIKMMDGGLDSTQ